MKQRFPQIAVTALFLSFALTSFPSCKSAEQVQKVQVSSTPDARTMNAAPQKEFTVTKVEKELTNVVNKWRDREEPTYDKALILADLGVDAHGISPKYDPHGISKLRSTLRGNVLFKTCGATALVTRGRLVKGGAIQTFGDLNSFLSTCENVA